METAGENRLCLKAQQEAQEQWDHVAKPLHSLGLLEGEYITANNATVRSTAKAFGISKSTVHKDVTLRLSRQNRGLYQEVRRILQVNKEERHLRGGMATRRKYHPERSAQ